MTHVEDLLLDGDVEHLSEGRLIVEQLEPGVDLAPVLDDDVRLVLFRDEDVSDVHFLGRQKGLRADPFASQVEGQPLVLATDVAVGEATVVECALRSEGDGDRHFGVRPDLALLRLNGKDIVLEQEHVIVDGFPDVLVLPGQQELGLLLALQHQRLLVLLFLVRVVLVLDLDLLSYYFIGDDLFKQHPLLGLFLLQLKPESVLLFLLLFLGLEGPPLEVDLYIALVKDLEGLLRLKADVGFVHLDEPFAQIHVPYVGFPHDGDVGLHVVVPKHGLALVGFGLGGEEPVK